MTAKPSSLADDPDFAAFVDDFIDHTGTPPSIGDIMMFIEARASVAIDKDCGTHRCG